MWYNEIFGDDISTNNFFFCGLEHCHSCTSNIKNPFLKELLLYKNKYELRGIFGEDRKMRLDIYWMLKSGGKYKEIYNKYFKGKKSYEAVRVELIQKFDGLV